MLSAKIFVATSTMCQPGWSREEFELLLEAAKFLRSEGADFVTDHGVTDEGEPWLVFCDPENCEVLVHFARISGEYLACVPFRNHALTGNALHGLIDRFLRSRCIVMTRANVPR
jgi:collagen type I/II/III/V/XI/XXIV/XXVII alpha